MHTKLIRWMWGSLLAVVVLAVIYFSAISAGWIGYMPPIEELENPISKYASQVISSDNVLLGTWSLNENRLFASREEIAPSLLQALVATEDKRFYEHSGIDIKSLARAIVKRGILGHKEAGGGSTITQQLAKQLYTQSRAENSRQRIVQKTIEWVIAIKLERQYSKDEILTLYLNYFDFLHHAVGVKTAARVYFNKEARDLTVPESAMLVGMCKNPSYFNPVRDSTVAKQRRNVVLELMKEQGYLSEEECVDYQNAPLGVHLQHVSHRDGLATYFREYLRHIMMAKRPVRSNYASWQEQEYHDDSLAWERDPLYGWCNKNSKKDGSPYNIYTDGLKIYTSIDSRMQRYAERSVRDHLEGYLQPLFDKEKHKGQYLNPFSSSLSQQQIKAIVNRSIERSDRYRSMREAGMSDEEVKAFFKTHKVDMTVYTPYGDRDTVMTPQDSILYYKTFLRAGFMAMDPQTGAVKAYVGGLDYTYFQYDMCMMGRRQIGSTIKPYLYALAMENGYTPCDLAPNVQRTYMVAGKPWTPRNANHARYGEMVTLKWGLANSNNWISAYLMSKLNPKSLVSIMRSFGINSLDVYPSMSLCLGTCDISVAEMVQAYTAFVNKGIRVLPMLVTRIENSDGEVVADFHPRMNEVISAESSYKMLEMLMEVVDHGTAGRLRYKYHLEGQIGGKTGTTNNNSDGWFIGFVPRLVAGCWVGGEDRDIHFDRMSMGQGATVALPIWAKFMQKVYADHSLGYSTEERFAIPDNFSPCATVRSDSLENESINDVFQ
ncbi:MAG: transglycosylase domain-containing protein [Prevotellaceae bacterium]|nr:transglycosylase domain-containing protein [Prevotellaceae bacterium]MDY3855746.1 transglycosylase domain-containing protein [Bacteroidaceae bacterium]